jgi:hypothetical protein
MQLLKKQTVLEKPSELIEEKGQEGILQRINKWGKKTIITGVVGAGLSFLDPAGAAAEGLKSPITVETGINSEAGQKADVVSTLNYFLNNFGNLHGFKKEDIIDYEKNGVTDTKSFEIFSINGVPPIIFPKDSDRGLDAEGRGMVKDVIKWIEGMEPGFFKDKSLKVVTKNSGPGDLFVGKSIDTSTIYSCLDGRGTIFVNQKLLKKDGIPKKTKFAGLASSFIQESFAIKAIKEKLYDPADYKGLGLDKAAKERDMVEKWNTNGKLSPWEYGYLINDTSYIADWYRNNY